MYIVFVKYMQVISAGGILFLNNVQNSGMGFNPFAHSIAAKAKPCIARRQQAAIAYNTTEVIRGTAARISVVIAKTLLMTEF